MVGFTLNEKESLRSDCRAFEAVSCDVPVVDAREGCCPILEKVAAPISIFFRWEKFLVWKMMINGGTKVNGIQLLSPFTFYKILHGSIKCFVSLGSYIILSRYISIYCLFLNILLRPLMPVLIFFLCI